jgi:dTDP-4-amino-4,6-dideoxygalactose transaminase
MAMSGWEREYTVSKLAILGAEPVVRPKQVGAYGGNPWKSYDLQEAICALTGAAYSYPVSNETAALIASLAACEVGNFDEVIMVGHTWVASIAAILRVNSIPIFVDIDPRTYMIDPTKVEAAITPRTKAIMPVDLFGNAAPIFEIMEIASRHDLYVVEDACQSGGAAINGVPLGGIAHATAFSCFRQAVQSRMGRRRFPEYQ